ncbi:hypothetical protein E2C01_039159 [Portunus trituberculatus]|uniref:Uncharacterized protein n=1 Tax=Portunus trituberculatus TaxID=210409 RepID=A0A5B7FCX4_PORTR|nr:hypothetical protein [Portunus trituberculatus]
MGQRGRWPPWSWRQQFPRGTNIGARTAGQDSSVYCLWVHI